MNWIGEGIIVVLLVWFGGLAMTTYSESEKYCHDGEPKPAEDLTRLESLFYDVMISPGMSLGCYLSVEEK